MLSRRSALASLASVPFAASAFEGSDINSASGCSPTQLSADYLLLARLLGTEKLLWPPPIQLEGYKHLDKIFSTRRAHRRGPVSSLPAYARSIVDIEFEDKNNKISLQGFINLEHVAGLLVLKSGKIALERYALGLTEKDHWTSMSMVKSITSTLVGCALHDGVFPNLEVQTTRYIPELIGTAYEGVTLRQLLTMSSGVEWNEDYTDPLSDVNLHYEAVIAAREPGGIIKHLRTLKRIHEPGTQFHYNSAETFVIGAMITRATGKFLADYLGEKIWSKIGAEQDLLYILESDGGQDVGGSSANAVLRDYGRFGLFILGNGKVGDTQVLPEDWIVEATKPSAPNFGGNDGGYGYQWWIRDDGFEALGFAGQQLYLNPTEEIVVVILSALPSKYYAVPGEASAGRRGQFIKSVIGMLHGA
jgi:CubicO group peptidase (beta-lactamase class C family)